MLGGVLLTTGALGNEALSAELTTGMRALASGINIDAPSDFPWFTFFLATGLPFALLAALALWRGRHSLRAQSPGISRHSLLITIAALLFSLLAWNAPAVDDLLGADVTGALSVEAFSSPVRLFTTFVHEAGHSLAALLSGGEVKEFTVSTDGSGLAITAGGNRAFILAAGYLGAVLFGAALFVAVGRAPQATRALALGIGLAIVGLTILYAGNMTTRFIGIGFGGIMAVAGWKAPQWLNVFFLTTISVMTGLEAVNDLLQLRSFAGADYAAHNDAAKFSAEVVQAFSPEQVAGIWAAVSLLFMAGALYYGLVKPTRQAAGGG